jgi:DNA polymerase I-like protein with 3'-5' exonuclease and polymerase domains
MKRICVSFADMLASILPDTEYFADTETIGFYGKIRLLQLYHRDWDAVQYCERPSGLDFIALAVAIERAGSTLVMQNAHYDLTTAQQQGSTSWVPNVEFIQDTLLLGRLALPRLESHSLDSLMDKVLGFDPYRKLGLDKKTLQKSNWSGVLTEDQLNYACVDVYYLPAVYDAVKHLRDSESYKLDMLTLRYCLDFQWNGMPVAQARLDALYQKTAKIVVDNPLPINVNSWQQVRPYIGQDESDDLALAKFAHNGCTKSATIRKVRKAKKLLSFLDKFDTAAGVILGKFKPAAKSGRLTSDDQNLQQLPRASKEAFGVEEDEVLIYADYAQLELRTICAITDCQAMAELFRAGVDLHTYTSDMLFGDEAELATMYPGPEELRKIRKRNRQVTKTANFSFLYAGGISMFIDILVKTTDIWLDETTAGVTKRRWANLWSEITAWQQKGISKQQRKQTGKTPLGREYMAERVTDYLNIENQGAGSEVAKLALHYLYKAGFKEKHPDYKLCNFIHDSFIIRGPNRDEYKQVAELLADCMQRAWFAMAELMKIKDLPMPVQVAVGHNWGDIENDEIPNLYDYELEGTSTFGL